MSNKDYAEDWDYESEIMGGSARELADAVVGHRIVSAQERTGFRGYRNGVVLTLDDGNEVHVIDTDDCCAYTSVNALQFLGETDNVITSVDTNEDFTVWHVYAAGIPVVTLDVGWSPGNPYYYGFGFDITIQHSAEKENA